jgi:hypothetical protein
VLHIFQSVSSSDVILCCVRSSSSNTVIAVSSDNDIDNEVLAVPISSQEEKTVLQTSTARIASREKCRKSLKLTSDEIVSLNIVYFCSFVMM